MDIARTDIYKRSGRNNPWRRQCEVLEGHRVIDIWPSEPQVRHEACRRRANLRRRRLLVLVAPAPVLASSGLHDRRVYCAPDGQQSRYAALRTAH
jgi:hypothetical protein